MISHRISDLKEVCHWEWIYTDSPKWPKRYSLLLSFLWRSPSVSQEVIKHSGELLNFQKDCFFLCLAFSVRGILKFEILRYYVASMVKYLYFDIEWNVPNCMIFEYKLYAHLLFKAFNSLWTKSPDSAVRRPFLFVQLGLLPALSLSLGWRQVRKAEWALPPQPLIECAPIPLDLVQGACKIVQGMLF